MGSWTKAKRDEHVCDYPKYAVPSDTAVGDIWTCDCGRQWEVESVELHRVPPSPDPREHDYYTAEFIEYHQSGIVPR